MKLRNLFYAVLMGAALVACSDDDDNNAPDNGGGNNNGGGVTSNQVAMVFPNGLPKEVNGMTFTTDAQGRVTKINDEFGTVTFTYSDSKANNSTVVMKIEDHGDVDILNMQLNAKGFVEYVEETTDDGEHESWWFEYTSDNRMCYMKHTEGGNEVSRITYTNGNPTKVVVTDDEGEDYTCEINYNNPTLANKGSIMLWDECLGVDLDEMNYAYYAGLLGLGSVNLPTKCTTTWPGDDDVWTETLTWTLNSNGFPTSMKLSSPDGYTETLSFRW